jgi:nucleotide-binding universal stress UspA family protein
MKSILVPIENIEGMASALETALLLARLRGSYIEGFALRFAISEFIAIDPAGSIPLETYRQDSLEEAAAARQLFETFMQNHNVPGASGPSSGPSYGWLDNAPAGEGFVGSHGRVFDVTVLGRPTANTVGLHNRAIESSLFESGRPVLLAPPAAPSQIASTIMVHWNGSPEQTRTTAFAMPLLQQARRVIVLNVAGGQGVSGPPAQQVVTYLKRGGVPAELMNVGLEGRSTTGEVVLAVAKAQGCDLLVKGAFTQSRLRQMIFGGTTSHILANAELPVLMAH